MIAVFDTNIVIDALNGVPDADEEYDRYERVLISRITWMEILVGAQDDDAQLRDFLEASFEIIPLNLAVAEKAVQLRRTHRMQLSGQLLKQTMPYWCRVTPKISTRNGLEFVPLTQFSCLCFRNADEWADGEFRGLSFTLS
jgi:hypothetical protein